MNQNNNFKYIIMETVKKPFWKSKTLWFNLVSGILMVLGFVDIGSVETSIVLVGNTLLRFWTTEGVDMTLNGLLEFITGTEKKT